MRTTLLVALLASALLAQPASQGGPPYYRARLTAPDAHALAQTLDGLGYDVLHGTRATSLEVCLSIADEALLRAAGFDPEILETSRPLADKFPPQEGGGVPTGYRDLATIEADLLAFAAAYPTLAMVVDASTVYGPGPTANGHTIKLLKISDAVTMDEDEPNVLFASNHHAREIVTPEIAMDIANRLLTGYGTDPAITALVDGHEIWIAPTWNPDGYDYVWTTDNLWRKNRSAHSSGQFGTDQNRNYLLGWDSNCAGSTSPNNATYKGIAPASEIETQTMLAFGRARHFAKVMDFHSFGREVLRNYLCTPLPGDMETFLATEATALATLAGYATRDPSADGEHQEWQMMENTSYAFLVETHTTFQPSFGSATAEAAMVWPMVFAFLERDIPVRGHVTDATTGQPLVASIEVVELPWLAGETRRSNTPFGAYHLFLPPGTYSVRFSAPGYSTETLLVQAPASGTATLDAALTPTAPTFALVATTGTNLTLGVTAIPPLTTSGYLVPSFDVAHPVGSGPLVGLWPDAFTFSFLLAPAQAGSLAHWVWPVPAPLFPAAALDVPLAAFPLLTGLELDVLAVALGAGPIVLAASDVVRLSL